MSNPARRPALGEDVHYQSYGTPDGTYAPTCRTAKVTATCTDSHACSLIVFNPTGIFIHQDLQHDEARTPGTWHFEH